MDNPYLNNHEAAKLERISRQIQEQSKPLPYALEKRGFFKFNDFFRKFWPVLSFATVMIFVFFFSRDSAHIQDFSTADVKALVSFTVVLVISSVLCFFIEYIKFTLNRSFWKQYIIFDKLKTKTAVGFIAASIISAVLSGAGAYMTSLELSGFKVQERKRHALTEANERYNRRQNELDNLINAQKQAIQQTETQIKDLRNYKVQGGKTEWKSARTAASLAPTLSKQNDKLTGAITAKVNAEENYQNELKEIDKQYGEENPSLWGSFTDMPGLYLACFVCFVVFVIEGFNIYANSYIYSYYRRSLDETGMNTHISANMNSHNSVEHFSEEIPQAANFSISNPVNSAKYERGKYDTSKSRKRTSAKIEQAKKVIKENGGDPLNKSEISRISGLSYSTIRRYEK